MTESYFPALDERSVYSTAVVLRQLKENPAYFDTPDCPYSSDLKAWFRDRVSENPVHIPQGLEDLEAEAEQLFKDLKAAGVGLDGSERLAWLKASTALFEKLIGLKERAAGVKAIADFRNTILEIIENVLTPEQRTSVMDQITARL